MEQDPDAGMDSARSPASPSPAAMLPCTQTTAGVPSSAKQPEQLMHIQYTSAFYNVHSLVRTRYDDWEQEYDFWAFVLDDPQRAARRYTYPGGYFIKPQQGAEGLRAGSKTGYYAQE